MQSLGAIKELNLPLGEDTQVVALDSGGFVAGFDNTFYLFDDLGDVVATHTLQYVEEHFTLHPVSQILRCF